MTVSSVTIEGRGVGNGEPCFVIAEIGINHNGDINVAKELIDAASAADCQAVKFQKRTPEISTPESQKNVMRTTPWGDMTYLDYKKKIEFDADEYKEIARYAKSKGLLWFASPWDIESVAFLEKQNVSVHKIASASITDLELLKAVRHTGKPKIMSTGMSTMEEIDIAVDAIGSDNLILMHSTSSYPLRPEEANLKMIDTLRERYGVPVGYSGHETGIQISVASIALGAVALERHITLDRAMWGSDHAASLEPSGLTRLVRDIRVVEAAMGDGVKKIYDSELPSRAKLRK